MLQTFSRSCFCLSLLSLSLALPLGVASQAQAAATDAPRAVIQGAMNEVIQVLRSKELEQTQRQDRIEEIAYARFDFDRMSRLVLAKNYKKLDTSQREAFAEEFRKHLSLTYGRRVESYSNESIEVGEARLEKNEDVSVKTTVLGGSADGVAIEYRMRESSGEWRVIDVIIEGVSLIANFRSQIQDIIRNEGADQLIDKLRQKNEERANEAATS